MKKEVKDGKTYVSFGKDEWAKIGSDKGWLKETKAEKATGAIPEEPAEGETEGGFEPKWVCKVCSYHNKPAAFSQGCPKCGSRFIDK